MGQSTTEFFIREYAGVNPENGKPQWYIDEVSTQTGERTGNRVTTENWNETVIKTIKLDDGSTKTVRNLGRYSVGNYTPTISGGLYNTFHGNNAHGDAQKRLDTADIVAGGLRQIAVGAAAGNIPAPAGHGLVDRLHESHGILFLRRILHLGPLVPVGHAQAQFIQAAQYVELGQSDFRRAYSDRKSVV